MLTNAAQDRRKTAQKAKAPRPQRLGVTVRFALGKRIRRFAESLAAQLGGWPALNELQVAAVRRAAELMALAEDARARRLAGDQTISLEDLVRLDAASDRALRRLNLRPGAAKPVPTLEEHLARLARERTLAPPEDDEADAAAQEVGADAESEEQP